LKRLNRNHSILNDYIRLFTLTICSFAGVLPTQELLAQARVETESTESIIRFERQGDAPFIPKTAGTFYSVLVANPAVTEFQGNTLFIFRGQGASGHDQVGMWVTPSDRADGLHWDNQLPVPILPISNDSDAFDSQHILDPGVVAKGDSLFLYYTGKSSHGEPNYSVGLAVSTDGMTFTKHSSNPIIEGGIAPEVVYHDETFYLFYQRQHEKGHWDVFVATSANGVDFDTSKEQLAFSPSQIPGSFDEYSVTTIRIFKEADHFYMTYGACTQYTDYPESIGLARSSDLLNWTRYAYNPIFERGEAGTWDEGALWFPTIRHVQGRYVMWYEGAGSGMGTDTDDALEASRQARDENYGGYLNTSFSQMGIAFFEGRISDLFK
jgi:predicted GH43/DUF377 family glycosyl hydrolase